MSPLQPNRLTARIAMGLLAATLCAGSAWADKPAWAGRGNGNSQGDGPPGQMKKQQRYDADRRHDDDDGQGDEDGKRDEAPRSRVHDPRLRPYFRPNMTSIG